MDKLLSDLLKLHEVRIRLHETYEALDFVYQLELETATLREALSNTMRDISNKYDFIVKELKNLNGDKK